MNERRNNRLQHAQRREAPVPVDPLPAVVEVAAYHIGVEAFTDVVRHAQASCYTIQVRWERDLVIEISDDGLGLPPEMPRGIGLRSMREGAEELGGSYVIATRLEGGMRVAVHLATLSHTTPWARSIGPLRAGRRFARPDSRGVIAHFEAGIICRNYVPHSLLH